MNMTTQPLDLSKLRPPSAEERASARAALEAFQKSESEQDTGIAYTALHDYKTHRQDVQNALESVRLRESREYA